MIYLLLAALWRLHDGGDGRFKWWPAWVNISILAIIVMLSFSSASIIDAGLGMQLWFTFFTMVNILHGHTDWYDFKWMPLRYSGIAAIAVFPLGFEAWPYVALCAFAGLMYPILMRWGGWLPKWWNVSQYIDGKLLRPNQKIETGYCRFDGHEAYARTIAGACILGGIVILKMFN